MPCLSSLLGLGPSLWYYSSCKLRGECLGSVNKPVGLVWQEQQSTRDSWQPNLETTWNLVTAVVYYRTLQEKISSVGSWELRVWGLGEVCWRGRWHWGAEEDCLPTVTYCSPTYFNNTSPLGPLQGLLSLWQFPYVGIKSSDLSENHHPSPLEAMFIWPLGADIIPLILKGSPENKSNS